MVQENDGIARECRPSACKGDTSVDLLYPLSLAAVPPPRAPPRLALALARALSCSLSHLTCSGRAAPVRSRASAPRATRHAPRRRRPSLRRWPIGHWRRRRCCLQLRRCSGPQLLLLLLPLLQRQRESPSLASGEENWHAEEKHRGAPASGALSLSLFVSKIGKKMGGKSPTSTTACSAPNFCLAATPLPRKSSFPNCVAFSTTD